MRAEPEGVAEWRVQGGKHLAAGGGVVVATAEDEIFGADEAWLVYIYSHTHSLNLRA